MRNIIFRGLFILLLPLLLLQELYGAELAKEFAPDRYHLIRIPCADDGLTVEDVFTGLPAGVGSWGLYRYNGTGFIELNDVKDQLMPDVGYYFKFVGVESVEASVNCNNFEEYNESLPPQKWTLSGNPYNKSIALADITLDGEPITDSILAKAASPLYVLRDGALVPLSQNKDRVEVWEGFFIYNPTAEGAGASAVGGRGGKVMQVTNLNDAGPGSLRACAESTGPRNCVFRLGGTITLQKEITVESPYLTIAGQTAPGGGITIRMNPNVSDEALNIKTHDVIVRYLRLRPGGSSIRKDNQRGLTIANINPGNVYNVIIDHCSIGWSSDETAIAWYDARDITFQWSIIHEGFSCASHTEATDCSVSHSKGLLVGSEATADHPASGNISIHHNVFAHHGERGPRLANGGVADVVNNVAYNMRYSAMQATNRGELEIYIKGNIGPLRTDDSMNEELSVKKRSYPWRTLQRHPAQPITTHPCTSLSDCEMRDIVLANSGSSFPKRDAVDKRIVAEIESFTGQMIDAQSQTGCFFGCSTYLTPSDYTVHGITDPIDNDGYPALEAGVPYTDTDKDGMDDSWEQQNGLNPLDGTDHRGDINQNGYTNLEDFLNSSDGLRSSQAISTGTLQK